MDLMAIGKLIAPLAPAAGSILGGLIPFPGGSLIGQKFGELIAGQFGVPPTPQAISEAMASAGEETARAKINAATEQARIQIDGFVEMEKAYLATVQVSLTQTGETMRAELKRQHWFFTGWRPAAGWIFDLSALVFGVMLAVAAAQAAFMGNPTPLKILSDAWPIFLAYLGTLALMVGVYIVGRSQEKVASTSPAALPLAAKANSPSKK